MNTAVLRSDWVGRTIDGKFPLLEKLGGTEKADVFRTEVADPPAQRAAIKLISAASEDAEALIAGWAHAATLSHPHLLGILDYGRSQVDGVDLVYLVTEFAEEALSQVIPERPLTAAETMDMLDPVLDALFYLHGKGLVHGHVKPSNILVVQDQVKLSTDGLIRAGQVKKNNPAPGMYDAPEIASGAISPAADVWSLGVTVVESLTQHAPIMGSANTGPVVPATVPQPFADVARKCLQIDPARRPTVSLIATLIKPGQPQSEPANRIDSALPSTLPEAMMRPDRVSPPNRRWLLAGVVALLLFAVIAILLMRSRKNEPAPAERQPEVSQAPAAAPQSPAVQPQAKETPSLQGSVIKGEVVDRVLPDVSESAIRTIHGKVDVKIRVKVGPGGDVSSAAFGSQGPSRYFAGRSLEAAQKWKFKPANQNGQPVPSEWILQFQFKRSGTEVTPVDVSP